MSGGAAGLIFSLDGLFDTDFAKEVAEMIKNYKSLFPPKIFHHCLGMRMLNNF
jgi:hypothetical protein